MEQQWKLLQTTTCWLFGRQTARVAQARVSAEASGISVLSEPLAEISEEYEMISLIASGTLCDVYKVHNKALDQSFALKVLNEDHRDNEVAVKQFRREVEASSMLTHPHIAAVLAHGYTSSGAPFVVQQLCDGQDLSQLIRDQGRFSIERAVKLFIQICEAMSHAHTNAVLHRDLKPSNVMVCSQDDMETVKLIDFGMSTVLQSARSAVSDVTRTGEIFGSPDYMSPEQCLGEIIDQRSDIYSFGCLMHEVMKGLPPFPGGNPVQVIVRHLREMPPGFSADIATDSHEMISLQRIVFRCLEKDPAVRYQAFDHVRLDLEKVFSEQEEPPIESSFVPSTNRRAVAAVLDGVIVCALSCFILDGISSFLGPSGFGFGKTIVDASEGMSSIIWSLLWFSPELWGNSFASSVMASWLTASVVCVYPLVSSIYHAVCESSFLRATVGKQICGLMVVKNDGQRLSFLHALLRHFSKVFLVQCWIVGCLLLVRDRKSGRQNPALTILDEISRVCVVRKSRTKTVASLNSCVSTLTLERSHKLIKRLRIGILVVLVLMFFALTSDCKDTGDFAYRFELFFLLLFMLGYRTALIKRKNQLLTKRQFRNSPVLGGWTTNLMRHINVGKPKA